MNGVVLFAHNDGKTDYYKMASYTANRVEKFLGLPTTIITNRDSVTTDYAFDNIVYLEPDPVSTPVITEESENLEPLETPEIPIINSWINKGKYQVFDLSPYDTTLVLDTSYLINSDKLLSTIDYPSDFVCYDKFSYLFQDHNLTTEPMSRKSFTTLLSTVMRFTKSDRVESMFKMIEMIQKNYNHYCDIHGLLRDFYRHEYALTIALRTVNGQYSDPTDYINGKLQRIGLTLWVERLDDTTYKVYRNKEKQEYVIVSNHDFHMISKENYMELFV
jgi:hypothetical protein